MLAMFAATEGTQTAFILFGCALFAAALFVYIFYRPDDAEQGEAKTRLSYLDERKESDLRKPARPELRIQGGQAGRKGLAMHAQHSNNEAAAILAEMDAIEARHKQCPAGGRHEQKIL